MNQLTKLIILVTHNHLLTSWFIYINSWILWVTEMSIFKEMEAITLIVRNTMNFPIYIYIYTYSHICFPQTYGGFLK